MHTDNDQHQADNCSSVPRQKSATGFPGIPCSGESAIFSYISQTRRKQEGYLFSFEIQLTNRCNQLKSLTVGNTVLSHLRGHGEVALFYTSSTIRVTSVASAMVRTSRDTEAGMVGENKPFVSHNVVVVVVVVVYSYCIHSY